MDKVSAGDNGLNVSTEKSMQVLWDQARYQIMLAIYKSSSIVNC